jgi:hypothetical protein
MAQGSRGKRAFEGRSGGDTEHFECCGPRVLTEDMVCDKMFRDISVIV